MTDIRSYSMKVHRSLLQRDLMGGIPQAGLLLLFILGVVFIYILQFYLAAAPIAALYFAMRALAKKDQWLIDIVLENINQKDILLP